MSLVCKVPDDDGGIWCPVEVATGKTGYAPTNELVTSCIHLKRGVFCPYYRYILNNRRIKTKQAREKNLKQWWEFWK